MTEQDLCKLKNVLRPPPQPFYRKGVTKHQISTADLLNVSKNQEVLASTRMDFGPEGNFEDMDIVLKMQPQK